MSRKNKKFNKQQIYGNTSGFSSETLIAAKLGDIESIVLIQKHYDPYLQRISTEDIHGTSYLNVDLYERLKAKMILSIPRFQL